MNLLEKKAVQIENPFSSSLEYDVIIGAVAHKEFLYGELKQVQNLTANRPVLINVKPVFEDADWSL